jgi:DNA-directed RNA polymerase subunit RPC12/RpoP
MSSHSPYEQLAPPYCCPDCGSKIAFRSRRRSITERYLLPMVLLQPVRCAECFRRDYRLLFTPVQQRMADTQKLTPRKVPAASTRNVA